MATDAEDSGFLARWSRRKALQRQGVVAPESTMPPSASPPPPAPPASPVAAPRGVPPTAATAAGTAATVQATAENSPLAAALPPPPGRAPADMSARGAPPAPPAPTLEEARRLAPTDDFSRFVGGQVDPTVKNTALRTLFSDPHFNVMDGLDIYIDDYGKPDPLPPGMLRQMVQSSLLGLFKDDPGTEPADNARCPSRGAEVVADGHPAAPSDAASATPRVTLDPLPDPLPHEDLALRLQPHDAPGPAGDCAGAGQDPGHQH